MSINSQITWKKKVRNSHASSRKESGGNGFNRVASFLLIFTLISKVESDYIDYGRELSRTPEDQGRRLNYLDTKRGEPYYYYIIPLNEGDDKTYKSNKDRYGSDGVVNSNMNERDGGTGTEEGIGFDLAKRSKTGNFGEKELDFINQLAESCPYNPKLCSLLGGIVEEEMKKIKDYGLDLDFEQEESSFSEEDPYDPIFSRELRTPEADLIRLKAQSRLLKNRLRRQRQRQQYGLKFKGLG